MELSRKYFEQAQKVMVGGVNSPVRSFKGVGGNPLIMQRGQGSRLYDVDGKAYADYCLSWGALILGHNHAAVRKTVLKAAAAGSSFGTTTKAEIDIARFIVKHVRSIDLVRFVNSGTEATMSAVRLARGFTKRPKILKFDGCYHGHFDDFLIKAGSGVAALASSSSLGIPAGHVKDTFSLPYNDAEKLGQVIERHWKDIACVIVEPVAGNMGVVLPKPEFLKALRSLTKKCGIVLIFDEVMTGFRGNLGCAQADFGIIPDMTCLGKIIGAGFPVGAYGGRADIMRHLAPLGGVYQAGTFSGNPVVMQAGLAALEQLTPGFYRDLAKHSADFAATTNAALNKNNSAVRLVHYKSMFSLHNLPVGVYAPLFHYLLKAGIYWPPADGEAFFVSGTHTSKDLACLSGQIERFFVKSRL